MNTLAAKYSSTSLNPAPLALHYTLHHFGHSGQKAHVWGPLGAQRAIDTTVSQQGSEQK